MTREHLFQRFDEALPILFAQAFEPADQFDQMAADPEQQAVGPFVAWLARQSFGNIALLISGSRLLSIGRSGLSPWSQGGLSRSASWPRRTWFRICPRIRLELHENIGSAPFSKSRRDGLVL